jgi:type IV pilus assembly protein PilB
MTAFRDEWLAKILIKNNITDEATIDELRRANVVGNKEYLSEKVVSQNLIDQNALGKLLEKTFSIPYINLEEVTIDKKAIAIVPEEICKKYLIFPYKLDTDIITIAVFDPLNLEAEKDVSYLSAKMVHTTIASKSQIVEKINEFYNPDRFIDNLADKISDSKNGENLSVEEEASSNTQELDGRKSDAPIVRLVNSILNDAIDNEASDIHIEPTEKKVIIRCRVDGILKKIMDVPKYAAPALLSRIKIISNLDIAESRKPQDGKAKVKKGNVAIDLRVSILPTTFGEKAVIRILDNRKANVPFEKLGITGENLEKLTEVLGLKQGIILATGPTGSGKTTTLYSALSKIKSVTTNILTVEDPIEYMMEGINQVQVNEKAGVTFASALRSFLRQDPDVILVGEIRDHETAEISIQASLTGHLVLSTLHTNSAVETITRLIDIGIDKYKVGSAVSAIIAQRLVRKICPQCRAEKEPDFNEKNLTSLFAKFKVEPKFYKGEGCQTCDFTGYKGRLGLYEILILDKIVKEKIMQGSTTTEIEKEAIRQGFKTFTHTALEFISKGLTDYIEISRVISLSDKHEVSIEANIAQPDNLSKEELSKHFTQHSREVAVKKDQKNKILVVEDDVIMRKLITRILLNEGSYDVNEATNGRVALKMMEAEKPDLMILDLMMPEMDGFEVLKNVRNDKKLENLPVIVLTALDDKVSHLKSLERGGDDFLTKPFDNNILLAHVEALFRRA